MTCSASDGESGSVIRTDRYGSNVDVGFEGTEVVLEAGWTTEMIVEANRSATSPTPNRGRCIERVRGTRRPILETNPSAASRWEVHRDVSDRVKIRDVYRPDGPSHLIAER